MARPAETGVVLAQVLDHGQYGIGQTAFQGVVMLLAHLIGSNPVEPLVIVDIHIDPLETFAAAAAAGGAAAAATRDGRILHDHWPICCV